MKKYVLIMMMLLMTVGGCWRAPKPIKTEVTDFNMDAAANMVMSMEKQVKMIEDANEIRKSISAEEFEELVNRIKPYYKDSAADIVGAFFNKENYEVNKNNLFPALYHENIEIVSAKSEKKEYKDSALNTNELRIREEYKGIDAKLKDFYREYIFKANAEGNWEFAALDGKISYSGNEYSADYLPKK